MKNGGFVPRYRIIYEDLARRIKEGGIAPGEKLPFERELCVEYGVERVTIRHALDLLGEAGLIVKRPGVGSFAQMGQPASAAAKKTIIFSIHYRQNDVLQNESEFRAKSVYSDSDSLLFFMMEQACDELGYTLLYTSVKDTDARISALDTQNVAGVLLISRHNKELVDNTLSAGVPVVCVNHIDARTLSIMPDNAGGLREAVESLVNWGHTRIAYIGGRAGAINAAERLSGFKHAMWDNGLECLPELTAQGNFTYDGGYAAMREILSAERLPTAVFAASDMMAIGAITAIREAGLNVPEDISVIGFDNIDMGAYYTPKLTTVGVDAKQIAQLAVESILRISDKPARETDRYVLRVPTTLIVRASAGKMSNKNESEAL